MISEPEPTDVMPTISPPTSADAERGQRAARARASCAPSTADVRAAAAVDLVAHDHRRRRQQERDAEAELHRVGDVVAADRVQQEHAGERSTGRSRGTAT